MPEKVLKFKNTDPPYPPHNFELGHTSLPPGGRHEKREEKELPSWLVHIKWESKPFNLNSMAHSEYTVSSGVHCLKG